MRFPNPDHRGTSMPEKPAATDRTAAIIESVLHEDRKFECPEPFRRQAHIQSLQDYERIVCANQ